MNDFAPKHTIEELIEFVRLRKEEAKSETVPDAETERRFSIYTEIEQRLVEVQFAERIFASTLPKDAKSDTGVIFYEGETYIPYSVIERLPIDQTELARRVKEREAVNPHVGNHQHPYTEEECAKKFGVCHTIIQKIVNLKSYK